MGSKTQSGQIVIELVICSFLLLGFAMVAIGLSSTASMTQEEQRFTPSKREWFRSPVRGRK